MRYDSLLSSFSLLTFDILFGYFIFAILFLLLFAESSDVDTGYNSSEPTTISWVHANATDSTFFLLLMHPDLAAPIEQLGMEIEQDDNETVTDFKQRFGEKRLWEMQINVTDLEELDLRCGGIARRHNMTRLSNETVNCMVQRCTFTLNAPEICPPDYKETDKTIFWIYFMLR